MTACVRMVHRLSAHQGHRQPRHRQGNPVTNFLVFGYDLIKGTSSDGATKEDNLYPGPTLRVDPGEKLIVHYDNDLQGLTIKDFYDPAMTPKGGEVPIYPPTLSGGAAQSAHPRPARQPVGQRRQRAVVDSRRDG